MDAFESGTLSVQHPAGHTAVIALQGATVISWKVNNEERLFTSSKLAY